ncbi:MULTISPECIES: ImmA/IrrE family metallo-endopeptidase [unclassified Roseobacter]|nr:MULTISPECIES: ImmA/IrrE family metallo-endopeptidase [unclassified Roseobacter]
MAKQRGERVVRELGIVELPVHPVDIAGRHDILVEAKKDVGEGVSGMLLRHGNAFGILYATHIQSEGFQRFSVAHELGHYFLDGHIDHVLPSDGVHASYAGFVSADPYEMEADSFAAGLLMPERLFGRVLRRQEAGLSSVEALADRCVTSLTATAIRYAELSEDAVAVVVSSGNSIDYCRLSETMKTLPQITWLKRGSPVPSGTATARFNAGSRNVAEAARAYADIDILDWLGGSKSAPTREEVIGLGSYGRTLTVLHCPTVTDQTYQDDDEEDEDDLEERWTPRFRR